MFKNPMIKKVIPVVLAGLLSMAAGINCGVRAAGTATTADATRFTLMISSDPQFEESDATSDYQQISKQYADMNALAANTELNLNVKGCIIDGDLTALGGKSELKNIKELMGTLNMSVYPGLGNHDYDFYVDKSFQNHDADRMVEYMYDWIYDHQAMLNYDIEVFRDQVPLTFIPRTRYKGSLAYSFDIGKVHLIQLQNYPSYTRSWRGGRVVVNINNSFQWLERDLAKARLEGKIIIVNLHDYGDSKFAIFTGDGRTRFETLAKEYGVSAVFCGHVHGAPFGYRGTIPDSNIPFFRCGATCSNNYLIATFDTVQKTMRIQKRSIKEDETDYTFGFSWDGNLNDATPSYGFAADAEAGIRTDDVGSDGNGQWLADVNGDGLADYVYNHQDTQDYAVLLGKANGQFEADTADTVSSRANKVGFDGNGQWLADVNGDGCADLVYNRKGTAEYWVIFGERTSADAGDKLVLKDHKAGTRTDQVGFDGNGQWLADVNGDGCADYVYNHKGTRDYCVMLGKKVATAAEVDDAIFEAEKSWGTRANNVGYDGKAQWLTDVNGDGCADYVYKRDDEGEYWVLLSQADQKAFVSDTKWLTRSDKVESGISGQGWADLNGDGKMDFIYNQKGTKSYWVILSQATAAAMENAKAQCWGARTHDIAWDGKAWFLSDINGDGLPDLVYINKDNSKEIRVLLSKVTETETD